MKLRLLASKGNTRASRGTTLIEMILYVGIVAMLLTGVSATTLFALDAKSKTRAITVVFSATTGAFERFERTLGESGSIAYPLPGTSSSTCVMQVGAVGGIAERWYVEQGMLFASRTGEAPVALIPTGAHVDEIEFFSMGNSSTTTGVQMRMTLSASSSGVWRAFQFTESFTSSASLGNIR